MFDKDFLSLRRFQLDATHQWLPPGDGLCFAFLKDGVGQYANASVVQRLTPGDILIWDSHSGGKLCPAKGMRMDVWSCAVRFEHLTPLFGDNEISLLRGMVQHFKHSKLIAASSPVAVKCFQLIAQIPPQFNLEHRSHLLRIIGTILNEEFKTAHHQRLGSSTLEEHVIKVFEELSIDELFGLSVEELASKFGCGRRHLNRLFHQYFGLSVGALRMEMRLQKAVSLLRDSNAKVIHVAEQCGFNHLGLFNTCFKRRFGSSPGRWRKQRADDQEIAGDGALCPLESKGLCPLSGKLGSSVSMTPQTSAPIASEDSMTPLVPSAKESFNKTARPPADNPAAQVPPLST